MTIFDYTVKDLIDNQLDEEWMREVDIYSQELNEAWDEMED